MQNVKGVRNWPVQLIKRRSDKNKLGRVTKLTSPDNKAFVCLHVCVSVFACVRVCEEETRGSERQTGRHIDRY